MGRTGIKNLCQLKMYLTERSVRGSPNELFTYMHSWSSSSVAVPTSKSVYLFFFHTFMHIVHVLVYIHIVHLSIWNLHIWYLTKLIYPLRSEMHCKVAQFLIIVWVVGIFSSILSVISRALCQFKASTSIKRATKTYSTVVCWKENKYMHGKECKAEYRVLLTKRYPANIIKKNIELSILFAYTESLNLLQMGILIGCTTHRWTDIHIECTLNRV